jgi:hypothetical protein
MLGKEPMPILEHLISNQGCISKNGLEFFVSYTLEDGDNYRNDEEIWI